MRSSENDKVSDEKDLQKLLKTMKPVHNTGDYVFCIISDLLTINISDAVLLFREQEGNTYNY